MSRIRKSSNIKLWLLMLLGLLAVAPFVAESNAQSLPKPQLAITSITREPVTGSNIFKSKVVLKWSVNIPTGVQISGFSVGGRRQSSSGSGSLSGSFPASARQGEVNLTEPINVPVTLDLNLSAVYTLSDLTIPAPDAQRSGNFPDAGVAVVKGTFDPPNPKVTIFKVEREQGGYLSANVTTPPPIKFFVTLFLDPPFSADVPGDAFGDRGFVLKGGQIELAITFNTGKTERVIQSISGVRNTFSVPRPAPGADVKSGVVEKSFAVRVMKITVGVLMDPISVSATKQITL